MFPTHSVAWELALVIAFGLGLLHGVTPDEHTWPITFSYSIGSYSSKGGRKAGFRFSATFILQRAIGSEIAYYALKSILVSAKAGFLLYTLIGMVMAGSAVYMKVKLSKGSYESIEKHSHAVTVMPMIHGFIAGWGVGAFAVIVYGVLSPSMPNGYFAWAPGAIFGMGTMVTQMLVGSIFGAFIEKIHLSEPNKAKFATKISSTTLLASGTAFVVVGIVGSLFPGWISSLGIATPINIPNLSKVDVGFFLAVPVVFVSAGLAMYFGLKELKRSQIAPPPERVPTHK
ncbi:MAG: hypothetical protein HKL84_02230 [Acidimicrobiaceae bacterium]|nr:hypothetical protein [Acidimicrobiaceae bacterium]